MKFDVNILQDYVDRGLLDKQYHPVHPLIVWDYTRKTQYDGLWDSITIQCRGLVTDLDGNVIAWCLPKFFNYEEMDTNQIPDESFEVTEKMDGSFGNVFNYKGEWIVSTRGSFTSTQAIKANEILKRLNTKYGLYSDFNYICEIIYPENKIIVDYGDVEKLVFITCFNVKTGEEHSIDEMTTEGLEIVKTYNGIKDYNVLKEMINDNQEGFVIRFESGMRMKIKGEKYFELQYKLMRLTNRTIWQLLKEHKTKEEIIMMFPEEFSKWIERTIIDLNYQYMSVNEYAGKIFDNLCENRTGHPHYGDLPIKKEYVTWVRKHEKHIQPILFNLYDNKSSWDYIWDLIYPSYEKPKF